MRKPRMIRISLFLSIILLNSLAIGTVFYGVKQFRINSQLASLQQASELSHILVRHQTSLFGILLKNGDMKALKESLNRFTQEEFILEASIYSEKGALLAHNQSYQRGNVQQGGQLTQDNMKQIIEPIYDEQGIRGFLRVNFDMGYSKEGQQQIHQIFHRLYGELIIVILCAVLLTASMYRFWRKQKSSTLKGIVENVVTKKSKPKGNALRYHGKRKK